MNLKKVLPFLKPFTLGLIAAVLLLFVQAFSDLTLPNYMSDIVNVGIQQSGITHAAPDALSQEGFKLLSLLADTPQRELLENAYILVPAQDTNAQGERYDSLYPKAESMLYIKQKLDDTRASELDDCFCKAVWTFISLAKSAGAQSGQSASLGQDMDISQLDVQQLYAFMPLLSAAPASHLQAAQSAAAETDAMLLEQGGIMLAKAFYAELGCDTAKMQTNYIVRVGLSMLGIALLAGVATVLTSLLSSRVGAGVSRSLRRAIFHRVGQFSSTEFDRFSTASLITRCTNDVSQVQMMLTMGIRLLCFAPIMGIGGVVMAVRKAPSMSWIIALAVVVLLGVIMVVYSLAMPRFKVIQELIDRLNLVSREHLSGLMIIRAFSAQKHEKDRFTQANAELSKVNLFINRVMAAMMPVMTLIMNGASILIVWVGAKQIAQSGMQVGDMMAFIQYAMHVIMSFLFISMMFVFVPRAMVSINRIAQVLDTQPSIRDPEQPEVFDEAKKGVVEFRNVKFRYDGADEDALHDIHFTALPGQTTAFIGSTGSGKSTIANLLMRFYDVSGGQILVSGTDIRQVRQKDLRAKIGYVPQKGALLSGTIDSNLRYGKQDASGQELEQAAKIAQAYDFIMEKEQGFTSEIAQDGANVSGGQRQRLSIARALAIQPDILVFDDSFSALDFKTDAALRKQLQEHTAQSTILVVAQRVSTILQAEQIIVLDQGRIVGRGSHRELLHTCPEYYEIASSQLAKEELE